jgi:hypothetical protein
MSESPEIKSNECTPNPAKVAAVVEYVRNNPGCTKRAASAAVAKQASYGYRFVQAAIDQGLIVATQNVNAIGRPYALAAV